jgi:hypothetical protein
VAAALRAFAAAAGEIPDSQWPARPTEPQPDQPAGASLAAGAAEGEPA